eukprot:CAMPEP_0201106230 /NCGR_PEP_ID=MMETSP0812-20130820/50251_1 /ASSEMBLY_ACC=CAM_ASM_000668 /TAXON_ID=98059 /ORGANISM="Dinobryon sp., Strain UTEXLB2267" /LENGTH=81 /DNA_ID=CAMNT_0047366471 /DNA_START=234 /DNA_END=480 /DNA_ORIENTATION=+
MTATTFTAKAAATVECTARALAVFGARSALPAILEAADVFKADPENPVKHTQLPSMHCPPLRQGDAQGSELRPEESSTTVG